MLELEDDEEWEVKEIWDKRRINSETKWLVKWLGQLLEYN